MSDLSPGEYSPKPFLKRPEGKTGVFFGLLLIGGATFLLYTFGAAILAFLGQTLAIGLGLMLLAALIYMVLDRRMRTLVWYGYKSVMRFITGMFVQIDPIGILKSYVEDLRQNLRKMSQQIGKLRGEMRRMKGVMEKNNKDIEKNLKLARKAREMGNDKQLTLSTRKAARLKETNGKYDVLHRKMEVMYRILEKMYQNSEILLEDTKDQVAVKEQERKAIRASHSAMQSAMNIIAGKGDKREMFDRALEEIANDVANKVGEMERFMDVSANFMDSIDLQNGVFEEEGMKMLEAWEKESTSLLLPEEKTMLLDESTLDINVEDASPDYLEDDGNKYDDFFG